MAFPSLWKQIQGRLSAGLAIKNWTTQKGYLGDSFTIVAITPDRITVDSPRAENLQAIPRRDFEAVEALWKGYCLGSVQRKDIRDLTRFSKYIISILHYVRTEM